jgi:hypothetical protein
MGGTGAVGPLASQPVGLHNVPYYVEMVEPLYCVRKPAGF